MFNDSICRTVKVTSTYDAKGSTDLGGTKKIVGRDFHEGDSWSFAIEAVDGAPLPVDAEGNDVSSVTIKPTEGNEAGFDLGTFAYDLADLGGEKSKVFEYQITESGTVAGVTNDAGTRTLKVSVSDNGDGTLKVEKAEESDEVAFTNTYEASGSYQLGATKQLSKPDATLTDDEFQFTAIEVKDAEGTALDGAEPETVGNKADGSVTFSEHALTQDDFDGIEADENGARTIKRFYEVSEVIPDGAEKFGDWWILDVYDGDELVESFLYDGRAHIMTVTATDNGSGTITCEVDKAPADVVFENDVEDTYENPDEEHPGRRHEYREGDASVTPVATKALTGLDGKAEGLQEGAFEFELVIDGEVVDVASNKADGSVAFRTLYYGWECIGKTYEYTIREVVPVGASDQGDNRVFGGIAYDTHEVAYAVTVSADDDDNVEVEESYGSEGGATFTNKRVDVSAEVVPTATKKYVDGNGKALALKAGEFEFRLLDSEGKAIATAKNKADGSATFKNVKKESEKEKKTKKSKLAKTSDLASPFLPQLTMLGSALLGGGVVLRRRKRRH